VGFVGTKSQLDPSPMAAVDVDAMLTDAARPKTDASLLARIWQRVSGRRVGSDVPRAVKVDTAALTAWAASERARVTVPAVDAKLSVAGGKLQLTEAKPGSTIDVTATVAKVADVIASGVKYVELDEVKTQPALTGSTLGKTILVSTSRRTLVLYDGTTIEKKYRCAVGTPGFPTPLGTFKIVLKRYRPTWSNPGSDWAKGMPANIGPGPGNPLGTRALNINSPGIRIHGTSKDYSIGTAASHGCMRMHMWDIEDLYERVKVGTRVIIVR
jgi:lipoprotein-anchoring transpeptidase ErfK/SrfK